MRTHVLWMEEIDWLCTLISYVCVVLQNMFISFKIFHKDLKDLDNMRENETKSESVEVVRYPEQRTISYLTYAFCIFPVRSQ